MPDIIVTLDKQDHMIADNETTVCGVVVPHGTPWVEEPTTPCPECFPKAKKSK